MQTLGAFGSTSKLVYISVIIIYKLVHDGRAGGEWWMGLEHTPTGKSKAGVTKTDPNWQFGYHFLQN